MADKEEYEHTRDSEKVVYYFRDQEYKVDQKSRVQYLKEDRKEYFPRGFEGGPKYKNIASFIFEGFKSRLPIGILKSVRYGWGFTKPLNPLASYVDDILGATSVKVIKDGAVLFDSKKLQLTLNESFLIQIHRELEQIYQKNRSETDFVLRINLSEFLPSLVQRPEKTYSKDDLALTIKRWGNDVGEFSDADKSAIADLFNKLSSTTDFLTITKLSAAKSSIDAKYIEETIKKFKEFLELKTDGDSLEKRWQGFLREYSWIFSSLFSQPVILFQQEAYVGGKTISNRDGKFSDFLLKNKVSDNVCLFEIKTHLTKLLDTTPYRGTDVFAMSKELTGCILQVLNQRDNFQKEFYALKAKARIKEDFESLNSQCIVLVGTLSALNEKQRASFELFRRNSRDVDIITFDEALEKLQILLKVMTTGI